MWPELPRSFPPGLCAGALRALVSFPSPQDLQGPLSQPALLWQCSSLSPQGCLTFPDVLSSHFPHLSQHCQVFLSHLVMCRGLGLGLGGMQRGGGSNLTFPSDKSPSC